MALGRHLADNPQKVVRVLRYFNELCRDPDLYVDVRFGHRGVHWQWDEVFGVKKIPPYDKKAIGAWEVARIATEIGARSEGVEAAAAELAAAVAEVQRYIEGRLSAAPPEG